MRKQPRNGNTLWGYLTTSAFFCFCLITGSQSDNIPVGTIAVFPFTDCPNGWGEYKHGAGKFILGHDKNNTHNSLNFFNSSQITDQEENQRSNHTMPYIAERWCKKLDQDNNYIGVRSLAAEFKADNSSNNTREILAANEICNHNQTICFTSHDIDALSKSAEIFQTSHIILGSALGLSFLILATAIIYCDKKNKKLHQQSDKTIKKQIASQFMQLCISGRLTDIITREAYNFLNKKVRKPKSRIKKGIEKIVQDVQSKPKLYGASGMMFSESLPITHTSPKQTEKTALLSNSNKNTLRVDHSSKYNREFSSESSDDDDDDDDYDYYTIANTFDGSPLTSSIV